jgi:hypothetical protein
MTHYPDIKMVAEQLVQTARWASRMGWAPALSRNQVAPRVRRAACHAEWLDRSRSKASRPQGVAKNDLDEGYRHRAFAPELYGDVLPAFTQWRAASALESTRPVQNRHRVSSLRTPTPEKSHRCLSIFSLPA